MFKNIAFLITALWLTDIPAFAQQPSITEINEKFYRLDRDLQKEISFKVYIPEVAQLFAKLAPKYLAEGEDVVASQLQNLTVKIHYDLLSQESQFELSELDIAENEIEGLGQMKAGYLQAAEGAFVLIKEYFMTDFLDAPANKTKIKDIENGIQVSLEKEMQNDEISITQDYSSISVNSSMPDGTSIFAQIRTLQLDQWLFLEKINMATPNMTSTVNFQFEKTNGRYWPASSRQSVKMGEMMNVQIDVNYLDWKGE
ncbi:hypothetical protein [Persicobacter sp. CCB-QB2]|uniref:hypothetical protein n=1 Tax=Persicobacter sp. CCB-QB2 TaxID=1561025 RepID=UPI0006A9E366|nr:hypothetical protein [Persicobacter sp. CCB-QB2]